MFVEVVRVGEALAAAWMQTSMSARGIFLHNIVHAQHADLGRVRRLGLHCAGTFTQATSGYSEARPRLAESRHAAPMDLRSSDVTGPCTAVHLMRFVIA